MKVQYLAVIQLPMVRRLMLLGASKTLSSVSQCKTCTNYIKGNALHCNCYDSEKSGQELIQLIEEVSSLTHGHNRSKLACILDTQFAIQIILGYEKEKALDRTIDFIKYNCVSAYSDEFRNFEKILSKKIVNVTKDEIKSSGYVIGTLEATLWTFFHADGYRNRILKAINLGGDTNTIVVSILA